MNMMRTSQNSRSVRGVALVLALAMLALFMVLGMVYVRHMNIENAKATYQFDALRASECAEAGVYAAIGELRRALDAKQLVQATSKPHSYVLPSYKAVREGKGLVLQAAANRKDAAEVTITDESGKVNLNHAPASVLQVVLGVDGDTARAIAARLPRSGANAENGAAPQWLASVDDLVAHGLLSAEQGAKVDPALVTTYTVTDHANPMGFLNVNAAPAEVLAAVLDVPLDTAKKAMEKRPFVSLAALGAAAEKDPATFNIKPDVGAPEALPAPLSFESRCFRIVSEAAVAAVNGKTEDPIARAKVDAVILFKPEGGYEIVHWNAQRGA